MFETLSIIFIVMLLGLLLPGPDFFLISRNAILYEKTPAILTALGVSTGIVFHLAFSLLGIAIIIQEIPWLYRAIQIIGALYLIYLGIRTFFPSTPTDGAPMPTRINGRYWRAYSEGFLCNLLNPKVSIFMLSLFTQFITPETPTLEKMIISSMILVQNIVYWVGLVMIIEIPRVQIWLSKSRHVTTWVFGTFLLLIGISIILH